MDCAAAWRTEALVDREAIEGRIGRLEGELAVLERARGRGREHYLVDDSLKREVERALQVAIQICIDVGVHFVAAEGLGVPSDYREVFERLASEGGLDPPLAERLKAAVGQRNLLVHAYLDIDHERIWEKLTEADDLREFSRWATQRAGCAPGRQL